MVACRRRCGGSRRMLHTVLALLALAVSCFSQQSSAFVLGAPERQESRSAAALSGLRNRRVQVQRAGRPARPATVLQQVSGEPTDDPGAVSAAMSVKAGGAVAEKMSSQVVLRGRIFLIFVSFLFGTLNVALKALYAMPGAPQASALSFARGVLAAACFTPVLFTKAQQEADGAERPKNYGRAMTMAALELAFWNFGAQGLLNVGLLYADAGRASFLTQTSVVITPLLSLAAGYSVNRSLWVGCGAALSGLVLLSSGGAGAGAAAHPVLLLHRRRLAFGSRRHGAAAVAAGLGPLQQAPGGVVLEPRTHVAGARAQEANGGHEQQPQAAHGLPPVGAAASAHVVAIVVVVAVVRAAAAAARRAARRL
uniref:EamA domain-containing protein n=1 Tax=Phaeomonas parva TaxID=124430 RepID=A0A7S1U643_9STRA|mmetsp:Transcript_30015/g.95919  ORF Transcript_30015/g.95919 Transcript_30015/m.95919 type:complete len:367 (+) Transcript_30015:52-1152(+)